MKLDIATFSKLFPNALNPGAWTAALNSRLPEYGIDTLPRMTAFLAQCGHESAGFTRLVENMNYSAEALTATWPKRFPANIAGQYARKPEAIANRAYANRMGNGDEASGDGWRFRGKGIIQLTGHDNQAAFAKHTKMTIRVIGGYLQTVEGAVHAACWYWDMRGCNAMADRGDMLALTLCINGGTNGLHDRNQRYARAQQLLEVA